MISESEESDGRRARALLRQLTKIPDLEGKVVADVSYGGGGTLPMSELPTRVVQLKVAGVRTGDLADGLRKADPPVIARVMNDQLVLDPRTIQPGEINDLVSAFRQVLE